MLHLYACEQWYRYLASLCDDPSPRTEGDNGAEQNRH